MPTAKEKTAAKEAEVAEAKYLPNDFVHMRHPQISGPAAGPVTYESFETVWKHKDWVLADPAEVQHEADAKARGQAVALSLSADDVDGLDQQSLEDLAVLHEIDPTEFYEFAPGEDGGKETGRFTGNIDLDGIRNAVKAKINGDTK